MNSDSLKQLRNDPPKLKMLTIAQAAALCGLKDDVISSAIDRGEIKIFTYFSRINPKIPMTALDEWIENNSHYKQHERKVI